MKNVAMNRDLRTEKKKLPTRPRSYRQRGSLYAVALITLAVLGSLSALLAFSAMNSANRITRSIKSDRHETLLQSGLEYALWSHQDQGQQPPFNFTLHFGEDQAQGEVKRATGFGNDALEITIHATTEGDTVTLTRIVGLASNPRKPSEFALFSNASMIIDNKKAKTTGDVYAGGHLTASSGSDLTCEGAVLASGQITGKITSTLYQAENSALIQTQDQDLNALKASATQIHNGNLTLPFGLTLTDGDVYYVQGNLHLKGKLKGKGRVVVAGNLQLNGDTPYDDADSLFVFIVGGDLKVNNKVEASGYFFVQNGTAAMGKDSITFGGLRLQNSDLSLKQNVYIQHDPRVTVDFYRQFTGIAQLDSF